MKNLMFSLFFMLPFCLLAQSPDFSYKGMQVDFALGAALPTGYMQDNIPTGNVKDVGIFGNFSLAYHFHKVIGIELDMANTFAFNDFEDWDDAFRAETGVSAKSRGGGYNVTTISVGPELMLRNQKIGLHITPLIGYAFLAPSTFNTSFAGGTIETEAESASSFSRGVKASLQISVNEKSSIGVMAHYTESEMVVDATSDIFGTEVNLGEAPFVQNALSLALVYSIRLGR